MIGLFSDVLMRMINAHMIIATIINKDSKSSSPNGLKIYVIYSAPLYNME